MQRNLSQTIKLLTSLMLSAGIFLGAYWGLAQAQPGLPAADLQPLAAGDCTWTGGSGDWGNPAKWSCGKVPGEGGVVTETVIVGFGSTITLTTDATIANLTINGGVISGSHALTVTGLTKAHIYAGESSLRTIGSRLPTLLGMPESGGIFRLVDPALTLDSLSVITVSNPPGSNGATILETGPRSVNRLSLVNGGFSWTGPLTVTEAAQWASASLGRSGANTMTVSAGAVMTITSGGHTLSADLVNNGRIIWQGSGTEGLYTSGSAQIINNGIMEVGVVGGTWTIGGSALSPFSNNGTFRRIGSSSDPLWFDLPVINRGLLEVSAGVTRFKNDFTQNAGELRLSGGSVQGNGQFAWLTINGGLVTGSGLIDVKLINNGGTVAPTGQLTVVGLYSQGSNGNLLINVAGRTPGTDFGVLNVTNGKLEVSGGLIINKVNGFSPASGDRFQVGSGSPVQGTFTRVSGSMWPAFGGFAGNGALIIAEPANAAILQAKPDQRTVSSGGANGYTLSVFNPTTQTLSINSMAATLPISFAYQAGSTSGAITANPSDTPLPGSGERQLWWNNSFQVPPQSAKTIHFGVTVAANTVVGTYFIGGTAIIAGQPSINLVKAAPVDVPLGAAENITLTGGKVMTTGGVATVMIGRSANAGLSLRVRITCPFPSCGNLLNVFVVHGPVSYTLQASSGGLSASASDYGFWEGQIPGSGIISGEPIRLFPDWDDHRPCISYDYGGGGGAPQGCVPSGDPLAVPQLYDPSGIIRDALTNQPIPDATVTLYRGSGLPDTAVQTRDCRTIDTRGGSVWTGIAPDTGLLQDAALTPAQIDPAVNPQVTGSDGRYGWNVVTGCWYVKVSAPGYAPIVSALVGVPPEVTDLDIALTPGGGGSQQVFLPVIIK